VTQLVLGFKAKKAI